MNAQVQRSNKAIAIAGCVLHQSLMARGCEAAPAIIQPVVGWACANDVGLIPWTCPETMFAGLPRPTKGIERYRREGLAKTCKEIADPFAGYLNVQRCGGVDILAIVGISMSPACSASRQARHKNERGIFIQSLYLSLKQRGIDIPVIDIDRFSPDAIVTILDELLTFDFSGGGQ